MPRRNRRDKRVSIGRARVVLTGATAAVVGMIPGMLRAGTWRDDVPEASFTALANNYSSVGVVNSYQPIGGANDYLGSGVLIADRWILTAAHLLRYNDGFTTYNPGSVTFDINGTAHNSDDFFTHPLYQDNFTA